MSPRLFALIGTAAVVAVVIPGVSQGASAAEDPVTFAVVGGATVAADNTIVALNESSPNRDGFGGVALSGLLGTRSFMCGGLVELASAHRVFGGLVGAQRQIGGMAHAQIAGEAGLHEMLPAAELTASSVYVGLRGGLLAPLRPSGLQLGVWAFVRRDFESTEASSYIEPWLPHSSGTWLDYRLGGWMAGINVSIGWQFAL